MTLPVPTPGERLLDASGNLSLSWRRFFQQLSFTTINLTQVTNELGTTVENITPLGTVRGFDGIVVDGDLSTELRIRFPGPHGGSTLIPVSDTAPDNPQEGQPWVDSTDGTFYIWYDDGSAWVAFGSAGGGGGGSSDAVDITYDPTTSGLTATDVQAALDELAASGGGGSSFDIRDSWLLG